MDEDNDFINIDEIYQKQEKHLYQIQIDYENINIVNVGIGNAPDVIIKDKIGKNSDITLISCVYTMNELEQLSDCIPIIKLVQPNGNCIVNYCISVKLDKENNIFTPYFTRLFLEKDGTTKKFNTVISKNFNKDNIIDILFEMVIDLNVELF